MVRNEGMDACSALSYPCATFKLQWSDLKIIRCGADIRNPTAALTTNNIFITRNGSQNHIFRSNARVCDKIATGALFSRIPMDLEVIRRRPAEPSCLTPVTNSGFSFESKIFLRR